MDKLNPPKQVKLEDYELQDILGAGRYKYVYYLFRLVCLCQNRTE